MNEPKPRVLCVDDHPNVLRGMASLLTPQFEVCTAESALDGAIMMDSVAPFAAVVTDLQMPNMNGIEFLRLVAAHSPDTCGILLTAHANLETVVEAVNEGHVFRFLTKPCNPEELLASIRAANVQYAKNCSDRRRLGAVGNEDSLTGLPNRRRFVKDTARLQQSEPGAALALVVIAIDDLELVRRTLGFSAADGMIVETAARLQTALRDPKYSLGGALLYRIEDRFALLWCETIRAPAGLVAEHLIKSLEANFVTPGSTLRLGSHAGISGIGASLLPSEYREDPLDMLRNAEAACLAAIEHGTVRIGYFSATAHRSEQRRLRVVQRLSDPEFVNNLSCVYQPQWHLKRDCLAGIEALVRWDDPELGIVAPGEFVPLAEERPEIAERLGDWVLMTACRQRAAWRSILPAEVRIAVNISATQLRSGDLHARIMHCLTRAGLPPELLEVEITESAAIADFTQSDAQLQALRRQGVRVAIDDFGVGFSSLSYLAQLPATSLKIDRCFIASVESGSRELDLLRGICGLGRAMHLSVVAEGVESADVARRLGKIGCDILQGYAIARPLPPAAFVEWHLSNRRAASLPRREPARSRQIG